MSFRFAILKVNDVIDSLLKNVGFGTFIWEATSSRWGNLFDKDGKTNDNIKIYPEIYPKCENHP